jgi:hypothetical protein
LTLERLGFRIVDMTLQTLRDLIAQRPFKPFRIVMSSGKSYEVRRPEMATLTRTDIYVGVGKIHKGVPAEFRICSLDDVKSIEPTPIVPPPSYEGMVDMTLQTFRDLLAERPFKPFRIVMSSGKSYEVRHPEMAWLTRTAIYVGVGEIDEDVPSEARICSLLHVTTVEPVDLAAPAEQQTGNPS